MYEFEIIDFQDVNISEFNGFPNKLLFTTIPWLEFLKVNKGVDPLIVRIKFNKKYIGYFTAGIKNMFGIKIVGAPFRGWVTPFMGLDLLDDNDNELRISILKELWQFLKNTTSAMYMEVIDYNILQKDLANHNVKWILSQDLECEISNHEEDIIQSFKKSL